jgi:hypoxanthine phosphoribosyltransferase
MSLEHLLEQNKSKDRGITVPDNWKDFSYSSNKFAIPTHYRPYLDQVMLPRGLVMDRTEKMILDLFENLDREKPIVALCVLKGGYQYFNDVLQYLKQYCATMGNRAVQFNVDFIRLKSYEDERAGDEVKVVGGDDFSNLKDKQVIVVEDIVDTGNTMRKLMNVLAKFEPASVKVVSMLSKRTPLNKTGYQPDYAAFNIPNAFVVGYALDYNEYFRDLPHICVLNQAGIDKFSMKNIQNKKL